ncbi:MAG: TolC family protein [Chlorobi bacterium]|nr:TolC family protein [Chlorobiota bacterium]
MKSGKKIFFLFLFSGFAVQGMMAQNADTLTLPACLRLAGEKYPRAAEKQLLRDRMALENENLLRSFYPELNLKAQAVYYSDVVTIDAPAAIPGLQFPQPPNDQYSVALDVRQLIYDGGLTKRRKQLETEKTGLAQQDIEVKIYSFKQQLSNLFFSALFLDDNYKILDQNLHQLETTLTEAKTARDHGVILAGDMDVLLAAKLDIRQKMTANRHDREAVIGVLSYYLDTVFAKDIVLTVPLPVSASAAFSRPEFRFFSLQSSLLDINKQLQDAMRRPRVYGFGQVGYGRPGLNLLSENFNTYYLFGARLSWNIWDWNQSGRKKKILTLRQEQIKKQEDTFRQQVEASLIRINEEIRKLDELIVLDEEKVKLRKQITGEFERKLAGGTITPAEYEQQLTAFQNARIQLNLHQKQKLEKQIDYLVTNGNLTDYENSYK